MLAGVLVSCEDPATKTLRPDIPPTPTPVLTADQIAAVVGLDHIDTELGFFISYPVDWRVDPAEDEGLAIAFKAPVADTDATGTAFTSITVDTYVPEGFPRETTRFFLETTLKNGVPLLEASLPAFELLAADIQGLPGGDAALFEFLHGQDNGRLHTMQLVFAGTTRVYAVTITALDSVFVTYLPVFLAVASSFTILGGR